MRVLVDTPIWSLALRRSPGRRNPAEEALVAEWSRLVAGKAAVLPPPVRYELLSGVRDDAAFERLRERLRPMHEVPFETADFEEAARCRDACRAVGVAAAPIDMFLCALAVRHGMPLFTTDGDFERYARCLSIQLHAPR